jgi:hypothetical protein
MSLRDNRHSLESAPTLVALIPQLEDETGHYYSYAKAVERACHHIGWNYLAALPRSCRLQALPKGWSKCLYTDRANWKHQLFPALRSVLRLSLSIRAFLMSLPHPAAKSSVLFIDSFDQGHLLAVILSTLLLKNIPSEVWIFCRYPYRRLLMKGHILRLLTFMLQRTIAPGRVTFLTDSKLLERSYSRLLSRPPKVMPIPHALFVFPSAEKFSPSDRWTLWWPGEPRKHKGLNVIKRIGECRLDGSNRFRLIVADSAGVRGASNGIQVETLASPLPMEEYAHTLNRADIILLPYDADIYEEATSGIFVETVAAGKIPLVSSETWMSFELERFHLEELAIDWDDKRIFARIAEIASSASIRERLVRMSEAYILFHNETSYANEMLHIYRGT